MAVFRKILVATDFSDSAQAAVDQARSLAAEFGASLHMLHVVSEPLREPWTGYAPGPAFIHTVDHLLRQARSRLEQQAIRAHVPPERVVLAVTWGDPGNEILSYAQQYDIDLIVCGTHGRRGLSRAVTGSVAERVVRFAPCPVLTVQARAPRPIERRIPKATTIGTSQAISIGTGHDIGQREVLS